MQDPILDDFGKQLIEKVRDETISYLDLTVTGKLRNRTQKFLFSRFRQHRKNTNEIIQTIIPIIVDATINSMLAFIDSEDNLDLLVVTSSGKQSIKELSDGLVGEIYGDGWIKRFSKKRSFEDEIFKNLHLKN
jgi:hypothetical protein